MQISKCFTASEGKMDCSSCHDPHSNPVAEKKEEHYRMSCLKCHGEEDCKQTLPVRQEKNDYCIACHMPTSTNNVVVHTSQVDHSIPRLAGANTNFFASSTSPDKIPIIPIATGEPKLDKDEQSRNLGVALVEYLRNEGKVDVISWSRAKPWLVKAVQRDPLDLPALLGLSALYRQRVNSKNRFGLQSKQ